MKKTGVAIVLLISFFLCTSATKGQNKVLNIRDQRQLFVDNYLIDTMKNTRLLLGIPHDEGAVLAFNKPWEGPFCNYVTMIKDENEYRVYYRGSEEGRDGSNLEVTCMAVSSDGIHWHRPDLGLFRNHGILKNNIVLANQAPSSHNFSPFIDKNPKAAKEKKYKALALGKGGLLPYSSHVVLLYFFLNLL